MSPEVKNFLLENYGIDARQAAPLAGYDSVNFKVSADIGDFVLKFYEDETHLKELLTAEDEILQIVSADKPESFSVPVKNIHGDLLTVTENGYARLLKFVHGDLMAKAEHTKELFYSIGKFLAEMDKKLSGFRSLVIEARRIKWDLKHYRLCERYLPFIEDAADRKLPEYFFLQNRERVEPLLVSLRESVIHNDANDWNVLVKDGKMSGLIDFGDVCYSPLINNLAVALTYALLDKANPVEWVAPFVKGYHETLPLEEKEIGLLYYLVGTRLAMSVCSSANAKREKQDTEYVMVSERPAWELLRKLVKINPLRFEDELRKTCGLDSKLSSSIEHELAARHETTSKALSLQFARPIKMVGAAFQYMYDAAGNAFLDCYNNIPQVGHCHPRVVAAGQRAMARLNTNTRYLNDVYNAYAADLLSLFPAPLSKVFFVNSGSAASDLAIRLALTHSQNRGVVVMEHGYHGNTRLGIEISHYKYNRRGGTGKSDTIIEAELPDTYRGRFTENDGSAGESYAESLFAKIETSGFGVAAFIAEPIVGCGGQVPLAKGFLKSVYPFIREQGGVCISDEVQTGFGRLGNYFWGFEMHEVIPDIVVLGKPVGNGHPMAAVVTTDEIAASFETGMEFFSSFGGNPVSCAIGQEVLNVIRDERLQENARDVGGYLLKRFEAIVEKFEVCGNARGEGLFLGLDIVVDKESKTPNTELAAAVKNRLRDEFILIGTDGPFDNVLKIKPPICFTRENADELADKIESALITIA